MNAALIAGHGRRPTNSGSLLNHASQCSTLRDVSAYKYNQLYVFMGFMDVIYTIKRYIISVFSHPCYSKEVRWSNWLYCVSLCFYLVQYYWLRAEYVRPIMVFIRSSLQFGDLPRCRLSTIFPLKMPPASLVQTVYRQEGCCVELGFFRLFKYTKN